METFKKILTYGAGALLGLIAFQGFNYAWAKMQEKKDETKEEPKA